jgi:hypothetical protein
LRNNEWVDFHQASTQRGFIKGFEKGQHEFEALQLIFGRSNFKGCSPSRVCTQHKQRELLVEIGELIVFLSLCVDVEDCLDGFNVVSKVVEKRTFSEHLREVRHCKQTS